MRWYASKRRKEEFYYQVAYGLAIFTKISDLK